MKVLRQLENYFIDESKQADPYQLYRHKLVLNASLCTSLFSLTYLLVSLLIEFEPGIYLMIFNVVGFLLLPFLMRTGMSIRMIGNLYVFTGTMAVIIVIYYSGGVHSPVFPWLIAPPVLALLIVGRTYSMVWTGVVLCCLIVFIGLQQSGFSFPVRYNTEWTIFFTLLCASGIILIVGMIALIFESNTSRALKETARQKRALQESNDHLTAHREELLTTSEQLKELNEKKDYLMEILAHDLKSPLANIQSLIGLVKMEGFAVDSMERKVIDMIRDSSHKSQNLIQKILSSENLENIVYNLNLEVVDVSGILKKAVEEVQTSAFEKDIRINLNIQHGKSFNAKIDRIFLTQVYENLLTNAIKFSPRDKSIYVSLTHYGQAIRAVVKDEGPGIQSHEMDLLFKKFKKLSNKPTGGESSTGLGLSIVKHYTELLKGKVWCESDPGEGASFIVEIPAV
jgi:signal transduction histidine kinase